MAQLVSKPAQLVDGVIDEVNRILRRAPEYASRNSCLSVFKHQLLILNPCIISDGSFTALKKTSQSLTTPTRSPSPLADWVFRSRQQR